MVKLPASILVQVESQDLVIGSVHILGIVYPLPSGYYNIAMESGPFIDDFPIETSIYKGFSMAMLNNQMVSFIDGSSRSNIRSRKAN